MPSPEALAEMKSNAIDDEDNGFIEAFLSW